MERHGWNDVRPAVLIIARSLDRFDNPQEAEKTLDHFNFLGAEGSDPQVCDSRGQNVLFHLAYAHRVDRVSIWLQHCKSDVHLADDMGQTALHYAAHLGYRDADGLERSSCFYRLEQLLCPRTRTTTAYLP